MINSLKNTYYRLINELEIETFRYSFKDLDMSNRLTGLIGPRGVGKTTMLLQYIKYCVKELEEAFYFSADHIYFNNNSIFEFIQNLYETEGISFLFIDEVHKYKNWNQELKNIYDAFPKIKIIFSGSSSLDLIKGAHDLSRRGVLLKLPGLSFREYLYLKTGDEISPINLETLINDHRQIAAHLCQIPKLKGHFRDYIERGYYPFIFESEKTYYERAVSIIEKTISEDIASHFDLQTTNLQYFKRILSFLVTIPPGKINTHNLAGNLGIDDKTVRNYIHMLQETGLAILIFTAKRGGALVRSPEKIFLENTSLYHSLCYHLGQGVNQGTIREVFFLNSLINSENHVFYSKYAGDFMVGDTVFEIGGKTKKTKQISKAKEKGFLVKDDILIGDKFSIPLYLFGFLY